MVGKSRYFFAFLIICALPLSEFSFGDEGFFSPQDLAPENRVNLEQGLAATVRIDAETSCSAAWISKEGHLITAMHCLKGALLANQVIEQHTSQESGARWYKRMGEDSHFKDFLIQIRINSVETEFQVVATGLGFVEDYPQFWVPDGWKSEANELTTLSKHNSDFVVLQVIAPNQRSSSCLQFAKEPPQTGSKVWAIGYPEFGLRTNGYSSQGDAQYITLGTVLDSYAKTLLGELPKENSLLIGDLDQVMLPDSVFLSNTDSAPGLSGGPLVDESGNLLGILTRSNSGFDYEEGTTFAVRSTHILDALKDLEIPGCASRN